MHIRAYKKHVVAKGRWAIGSRVYAPEPETLEPKVAATTTITRWAMGSRIYTLKPETLEPAATQRWAMGSYI